MFACIHSGMDGPAGELPGIAGAFSPAFERTDANTIVFDIDALKRLYKNPQQIAEAIARRAGSKVHVAIAETADAAILAARHYPGVTAAPDLSPLPAACLTLTDEMREVFESWGVHTLGDLAKLPEAGLAERFGAAGVRLRQLALGEARRPLHIDAPRAAYADRIELEHPAALLEPLLFPIARMLNEQCERLQSHAMATNAVHLRLELEGGAEHRRTIRLPLAMRQSPALLKLLRIDLEAHPPPAATVAVALALTPAPPRVIQHGIFLPLRPAPDKLELTLARLRALAGEENVGVPELLDTHHPHPFRLAREFPAGDREAQRTETRQAFRYFRPPEAARVETQNGRPARLAAAGAGIAGKVETAAGPWRTSGAWWTEAPWNRDEWDIALSDGALYRIYREIDCGGAWFIEGAYD